MNVVRELSVACYTTTDRNSHRNRVRSLHPIAINLHSSDDGFQVSWSEHTYTYFTQHGVQHASGGARVVREDRLTKHYWGEG